jgi:hypothetical protein
VNRRHLKKQLKQYRKTARSEQRRLHSLWDENPDDSDTLVNEEDLEIILNATKTVEKYIRTEYRRNFTGNPVDSSLDSQQTSNVFLANSTLSRSGLRSHSAVSEDRSVTRRRRGRTAVARDVEREAARVSESQSRQDSEEPFAYEEIIAQNEDEEGIPEQQDEYSQRRQPSEGIIERDEVGQPSEVPITQGNIVGPVVHVSSNDSIHESLREWRVSLSESGDTHSEVDLADEAQNTTRSNITAGQEMESEHEERRGQSTSTAQDDTSKNSRRSRDIWQEMRSESGTRVPRESSSRPSKPVAPFQESDRKKKPKPRTPEQ